MYKQINKYTGKHLKTTLFPDGQPHINLVDINAGDDVSVIFPIRSALELVQLMEVSNALDHIGAEKYTLCIPYLMGARSDRHMVSGDSCDLEVVAKCINMLNFPRVLLYDVHSDVALKLINGSTNITNDDVARSYDIPNSILVCPDTGAKRHVDRLLKANSNITDVIYCTKSRDLATGRITLTVNEPEKVAGRPYIIIDDLCDGGGTFNAIAEQLKPHNPSNATLMVTHGVFSAGFSKLAVHFDSIITTNSFSGENVHNAVKVVSVFRDLNSF